MTSIYDDTQTNEQYAKGESLETLTAKVAILNDTVASVVKRLDAAFKLFSSINTEMQARIARFDEVVDKLEIYNRAQESETGALIDTVDTLQVASTALNNFSTEVRANTEIRQQG